MNSLIAWAAWLEATALGEQMRSSMHACSAPAAVFR
jgi:hypothetical protein